MGNHALEQGTKCRDIPLPVSEVIDVTALGIGGAGAKRLVEGAIGGGDVQMSIEDKECAGYRLDNVAGGNILHALSF